MDAYDELHNDGEAAIDRWIAEHKAEGLNFDCKRKADTTRSELCKDDKENLVRVISAFANSDGGTVVWGVDARKFEGIDRVTQKLPIARLAAFRSEVEHSISNFITPPIGNISYLEVPSSEAGAGYLAIRVGLSEGRPHQSKLTSRAGFFFRNGHQSLPMEVYQIRDQILRRAVPQLSLEWALRPRRDELRLNQIRQQLIVPLQLELSLRNNSQMSARFPYLTLKFDPHDFRRDGGQADNIFLQGYQIGAIGLLQQRASLHDEMTLCRTYFFDVGADICIHPGNNAKVAGVQLEAPGRYETRYLAPGSPRDFVQPNYLRLRPFVLLEASFGCLDAPMEKVTLSLRAEDVAAKLARQGRDGEIELP